MKIKFTLLSLLLLLAIGSFAQQTKRVLFIGNSYTAVNNLPQLVHDVTQSTGDSLVFDSNAPGSCTFQLHSTLALTTSKIMAGNWDRVVLQEQSQVPSFPLSQVQSDCFPYAKRLDSLVHAYNTCAKSLFYMTWGRKNGDAGNCAVWPPVCTYNGMDSLLQMRYRMMADSTAGEVSPVGAVWHYLRTNFPSINLYQADESHPTIEGSYAAACCFYTAIFKKDPNLITYNSSLSTGDAMNIRNAVKLVVFDSLAKWKLLDVKPNASFTTALASGTTIQFVNNSTNATAYYWSFGDGNNSTSPQPNHVYATNGSYTVSLIASSCTGADTSTLSVQVGTTSIALLSTIGLSLSPNPVSTELTISGIGEELIQLKVGDVLGKTYVCPATKTNGSIRMDVSSLPAGVYLLEINYKNLKQFCKFIKQ